MILAKLSGGFRRKTYPKLSDIYLREMLMYICTVQKDKEFRTFIEVVSQIVSRIHGNIMRTNQVTGNIIVSTCLRG